MFFEVDLRTEFDTQVLQRRQIYLELKSVLVPAPFQYKFSNHYVGGFQYLSFGVSSSGPKLSALL